MKRAKFIAVLLTFVTLFTCISFTASAVSAQNDATEIEAIATAYIQSYVDTVIVTALPISQQAP